MRELEIIKIKEIRRIMAESAIVIILAYAAYAFVIEPALFDLAPGVYSDPRVDYGQYNLPDTANDFTHYVTLSIAVGVHFYYRLYLTDLGGELREKYRTGEIKLRQ